MLCILKIDHYLIILTDEEVTDFVAIIFSEYFKSITAVQNLRIFLTTPDEVKKHVHSNSSDNCITALVL